MEYEIEDGNGCYIVSNYLLAKTVNKSSETITIIDYHGSYLTIEESLFLKDRDYFSVAFGHGHIWTCFRK